MIAFEEGIRAFDVFVAAHGHAFVPRDETINGVGLGRWLLAMQSRHRRQQLSPSESRALTNRGMDWSKGGQRFAAGLASLEGYRRTGGTNHPVSTYFQGFALGRWVSSRRNDARQGHLSPARRRALENLGMAVPGVGPSSRPRQDSDAAFAVALSELQRFREAHGHVSVPARYSSASGYRLGQWAWWIRGRRREGRLPAERVTILDAMGFSWDPRGDGWAASLAEGPNTGWARRQASLARRGFLRRERAESLEGAGVIVELPPGWFETGIDGLRRWHADRGDELVAPNDIDTTGFAIGVWTVRIRERRRLRQLTQGQIAALDEAGFVWSLRDARYERGLIHIREFVAVVGHGSPRASYRSPDGFALGRWCAVRRMEFREGRLAAGRVAELERAGIDWRSAFAHPHGAFEEALAGYREHVARHGQRSVGRGTRMCDGRDLGVWVGNMRAERRAGRLSDERIAALDAEGFVWAPVPRAAAPNPSPAHVRAVAPVACGPIGELIRDLRRRRGWTTVACARALGVSTSWVVQQERGRDNGRPRPDTILAVAAVCGLSPDQVAEMAGYRPDQVERLRYRLGPAVSTL
jgi:DNA-binding XRE family transcriptional regulator